MRKTWLWVAAVVALNVCFGYFSLLALQSPALPRGILYGNGHIEGTEIAVSAEVSSRVLESRLEEGRSAAKGDLLVRLDDAEPAARLQQTRARIKALTLEQARVEVQLKTARHHLETAVADLARYQDLHQEKVFTPQKLSQVENTVAEARNQVNVLRLRAPQLDAELKMAHRQVALWQIQLTKSRIKAPIAGTMLVKGIEVGELATPG